MEWIGLDIGGANIKLADSQGRAVSRPFALWNNPAGLTAELAELLSSLEPGRPLAVTMTGELADCFVDKTEGVLHICESVARAAPNRSLRFYSNAGRWLKVDELCRNQEDLVTTVAAANWHALARYAARFGSGTFQLHIDIGSTTTDIIPIRDGFPPGTELTDTERLTRGELVYAGVRRTPISSLVSELPWRGLRVPVAREYFASTLDAFLLLGDLPVNVEDRETADGQPATIEFARARMARMICACPAECSTEDVLPMAGKVVSELRQLIMQALEKVLATAGSNPGTILLSGEGSFLGRQVAEQVRLAANLLPLDDVLSPPEAAVAPAVAVAVLASEEVTP